jgi:hypothetical protein
MTVNMFEELLFLPATGHDYGCLIVQQKYYQDLKNYDFVNSVKSIRAVKVFK